MPSDKLETVDDTKDRKQADFQGAPVDQLFHSILDPRGKLLKIPALVCYSTTQQMCFI